MRQIFTVFAFTFKDGLRKKAFILSTVVILVLIAVGCTVPAIMDYFDDGKENVEELADDQAEADESENSGNKICYYLDENSIIEDGIEILKEAIPQWNVVVADPSCEADYRAEIAESENVSLVKITMDEKLPYITIVNKNFMSGTNVNVISNSLSESYIHTTLLNKGIDEETIEFAQSTLPYVEEYEGDMSLGGYIVGILMVLLTFYAVYYYGYGVSMSVATEKTSRVMETLIVSAKPSRILIGKCLGMGLLGLAQFIVVLGFGAVCFKTMVPEDFTIEGLALSLDGFTFATGVTIVLFFILGYALYAMLNSVCGASVSKIEDLNAAMMPVMFLTMISFYISYFTMISTTTDSLIQKIALYVPLTSPFIMPYKLLNSDIATMDVVIAIVLLIIAIIVVSVVSIRVYSSNVLHYGKRLKLKEMISNK